MKMEFSQIKLQRTRSAFLWTNILRAPFWAIYNLLLFILYKDLHATPFQIALFIALKPTVSLFSMYWSSYINKRPDRLLSNVVWAGVIGYLPFLLFPFFYNVWFVLAASSLYMMMFRGVVPAWMEIFKLNLPGEAKQKVFAYGSIVSYVVGAILPLLIGPLLDVYALSWRWIFAFSAILSMIAIIFQLKIPIEYKLFPVEKRTKRSVFLDPWKNAWKILSEKKGFRNYQIGFMIFGGAGLMIMQPALPQFFIDVLGLSYTELSIALTLCKGCGFALTSPLWARSLGRSNFYHFSGFITFLAALFPLILFTSQISLFWLYFAYFAYGVMQAGSELSWHLSGPIFAKNDDSSLYSSVNILTVGLRGCVLPQIGSVLCLLVSSSTVLLYGAVLCLVGTVWMFVVGKKQALLEA
jgi:MFS family permease